MLKNNNMISVDDKIFTFIKRDYSRKEKIQKLQIESDKLEVEIWELEYENSQIDKKIEQYNHNPHYWSF